MLLELPIFEHIDATDVDDAASCLDRYGEKARVIAGATDLLSLMKDRIEGPGLRVPEVLVNIKTIPGMTGITYDKETGLRIGAAVTLNQLATSDLIRQRFSMLSQAALQVGTTQLRNVGTVGGNCLPEATMLILQAPALRLLQKGRYQVLRRGRGTSLLSRYHDAREMRDGPSFGHGPSAHRIEDHGNNSQLRRREEGSSRCVFLRSKQSRRDRP